MLVLRIHLLVLFAAFVLLMAVPNAANAQGLITGTIASFDQPVEIPGHVLPAGTYAFVDKGNSVVQVWDKYRTKLFATLITNAAVQSEFIEERQEFEFEKVTPDKPMEIKAWFQGSGSLGREFIYSK